MAPPNNAPGRSGVLRGAPPPQEVVFGRRLRRRRVWFSVSRNRDGLRTLTRLGRRRRIAPSENLINAIMPGIIRYIFCENRLFLGQFDVTWNKMFYFIRSDNASEGSGGRILLLLFWTYCSVCVCMWQRPPFPPVPDGLQKSWTYVYTEYTSMPVCWIILNKNRYVAYRTFDDAAPLCDSYDSRFTDIDNQYRSNLF